MMEVIAIESLLQIPLHPRRGLSQILRCQLPFSTSAAHQDNSPAQLRSIEREQQCNTGASADADNDRLGYPLLSADSVNIIRQIAQREGGCHDV